ncbi:MAG: polymer-forming cytoskeletal protein [Myxococcales bacterium]|nr:polymer-forming cytoskeletal protein [Myxococcales bacterium]
MVTKHTVIGQGAHVVGEVRGDDSLVVQGRVDGRIHISEDLSVEPGAILQADVEARNVTVSGVVVGGITASSLVRLTPKARVVGNISAPKVAIEAGAAYRGRIEMGPVDLARAASATARSEKVSISSAPAAAKAPPRLAPPSRVAAVTPAPAPQARPAPPRAAAPAPRATTAAAQTPSWARKKAVKRR